MENRLSLAQIFAIHKKYWKVIFLLTLLFPLAYTGYRFNKKPYFIANSVIQVGTVNGVLIIEPDQLVELLKMKSVQDEILELVDPNLGMAEPYIVALSQAKVLRPVRNIQISFHHANPEYATEASLKLTNAVTKKMLSRDIATVSLDSDLEASIKNKLHILRMSKDALNSQIRDFSKNNENNPALFSQNVLLLSILGSRESEINYLESELAKTQKNLTAYYLNKSKVYFKSLENINNPVDSVFGVKLALVALLGYIIALGLSLIRVFGFKLGD